MPVDQRHIFAYNNIDQHIPPDNIHIQLAGGGNVFLASQHVAGGSDVSIAGDTLTSWNRVQAAQSPPLGEDAARRDTFQVELSATHLPAGYVPTNSVSFPSATNLTESFTFVTPRRLISLDAFNGGVTPTSITISCAGQAPKVVSLGAGQVTTIATGWSGNCSSVTITSTNGWNTNLDNIRVQ
jgi:hypothetical protein